MLLSWLHSGECEDGGSKTAFLSMVLAQMIVVKAEPNLEYLLCFFASVIWGNYNLKAHAEDILI